MGKKQPELYRIPRKPGYLGGYNWRATALGCLLLVVVNFVATQYIAARFQYQPALGAPILRAKSGGIYQPFSWIVWGWRYCTSQDERIRRPFFEGEMIVFAGSFLCVGIFFVLASRRTRKLTENAEDLHGSARWADEDDVRDTGLLDHKARRLRRRLVSGGRTPVELPPAQRPRTRSRLRANAERQRRRPGDPVAAGLGRERRDL